MGLGSRFKNWFYFSRASRSVILFLCGILLGIGGCTLYLLQQKEKQFPPRQTVLNEKELPVTGKQATYSKQLPVQKPKEDMCPKPAETFYFDPNTADSITLQRLGLNKRIIRNLYKYRAHGGVFHRAEDFAKLYGLTKGDFDRLYPYIRIDERFKLMEDLPQPTTKESVRPKHFHTEKYPTGTQIDINTADTNALKKIPGIGSYYARKIINYREQLGGFYSTKQLKDIKGLPDNISQWFTTPEETPRKLSINLASFDNLHRHPYLNYYQCRVIMEHRRKYGPIKNLNELSLYDEFSKNDLERLSPYLSFEK